MSRFTRLARGLNRRRGEMNKAETDFAVVLDRDIQHGAVSQWWFEGVAFRLSRPPVGQPARYTPDFMVLRTDGEVWIIDVKAAKGFDDNAAIVRAKAAAEQYHLFRFFLAYKQPKKAGGGFTLTEV